MRHRGAVLGALPVRRSDPDEPFRRQVRHRRRNGFVHVSGLQQDRRTLVAYGPRRQDDVRWVVMRRMDAGHVGTAVASLLGPARCSRALFITPLEPDREDDPCQRVREDGGLPILRRRSSTGCARRHGQRRRRATRLRAEEQSHMWAGLLVFVLQSEACVALLDRSSPLRSTIPARGDLWCPPVVRARRGAPSPAQKGPEAGQARLSPAPKCRSGAPTAHQSGKPGRMQSSRGRGFTRVRARSRPVGGTSLR